MPLLGLLLVLLSLGLSQQTNAQSSDINFVCSTSNDRLDPYSHKFFSDCDEKTFCSAPINGTCLSRRCRRDEYPFGFTPGEVIPPLCPDDSFCPDEGSGCMPLLSVGSRCQLNRDDQCGPPKDWMTLANHQNFNGSLCLHSTCVYVLSSFFTMVTGSDLAKWIPRYANATFGQKCIADQTTYIDVGPGGEEFNFTVTRHNCRTPSYFCDPRLLQCVNTKGINESCTSDQDCQSVSFLSVVMLCLSPG